MATIRSSKAYWKQRKNQRLKAGNILSADYLQFERSVIANLGPRTIPFPYQQLKRQVKISVGATHFIVDAIIESGSIHYLIEIKHTTALSSLAGATKQIEMYKSVYEQYLAERKMSVVVQPLIIVPKSIGDIKQFRGIPIVSFDQDANTFSNLKAAYGDYELNLEEIASIESLSSILLNFLGEYSRWAFSPLRISKMGIKAKWLQ